MSSDLTIETVLADPMIRAVMRADHVEPRAFETLLRGAAALRADRSPGWPPRAPAALVAGQARAAVRGFCCA